MPNHLAISRRNFALASLGLPLIGGASHVVGQPATPAIPDSGRPDPVHLDFDIVISDFRILRGDDAPFIIEIENHGDAAIDTPVIGATVSDAPDMESSFLWADPWHVALEPGGSTFGIGYLPQHVSSFDQLTWTLCEDTVESTRYADDRSQWDFDLEYEVEIVSDEALRIHVELLNSGPDGMRLVDFRGLFRDQDGRICGSPPELPAIHLASGESIERSIGFSAGWESPINPFNIARHTENLHVTMDIQPRGPVVRPGCAAVMPWNQDD